MSINVSAMAAPEPVGVPGHTPDDPFGAEIYYLNNWTDLNGPPEARMRHLDMIVGFRLGIDRICFADLPDVTGLADLRIWKTTIGERICFIVKVKKTDERIIVELADSELWTSFFDAGHFDF